MKCKFCDAELESGSTICPVCGKENNAEAETPLAEQSVAGESTSEPVEADVMIQPDTCREDAGTGETAEGSSAEEAAEEESASPVSEPETDVGSQTEDQGDFGEEMPTQPEKRRKMTPGKLALIYAGVVVLVGILVALVFFGMKNRNTGAGTSIGTAEGTVPKDGNSDDVTCKGSYTVSDKKIKSKSGVVVATADGAELTNSELQICYWMEVYDFMQSYSSSSGVDFTVPLDRQATTLSDGTQVTWQQYFLDNALKNWHMYYAFCKEADATSFEIDGEVQDYLKELKTNIEQTASDNGFENAEDMIHGDMGAGSSMDSYMSYMERYYKGYSYYSHLTETLNPSEEQIEAYFKENSDTLKAQGVEDDGSAFVNVRHILIAPEGGTTDESGNTTYSDAEWEACEKKAQDVLDTWLAGAKTEDSFADLAGQYSTDPGSNTNGGLYEYVGEGDMVTEFNDWCFDQTRQPGDYGLVKTRYGYHVMYFCESMPVWYAYAQYGAKNQMLKEKIVQIMDKYPVQVDYSKIMLGYVDQTAS